MLSAHWAGLCMLVSTVMLFPMSEYSLAVWYIMTITSLRYFQ